MKQIPPPFKIFRVVFQVWVVPISGLPNIILSAQRNSIPIDQPENDDDVMIVDALTEYPIESNSEPEEEDIVECVR